MHNAFKQQPQQPPSFPYSPSNLLLCAIWRCVPLFFCSLMFPMNDELVRRSGRFPVLQEYNCNTISDCCFYWAPPRITQDSAPAAVIKHHLTAESFLFVSFFQTLGKNNRFLLLRSLAQLTGILLESLKHFKVFTTKQYCLF